MSNVETRLAQIAALRTVLPASWAHLAEELRRMRDERLIRLIAQNDEQVRGQVKMIDELLRLPNTLDQEMQDLAQSLPE
jgi:ppGpp synthetase/RelA/SpoT-type nucleotidyltranferase